MLHAPLQRLGAPQGPVIFEVCEVSVRESGVFERKTALGHLPAKSPSPPLETKDYFYVVEKEVPS